MIACKTKNKIIYHINIQITNPYNPNYNPNYKSYNILTI